VEFEGQLKIKMSPSEPLLEVKGVFGMVNGVFGLVVGLKIDVSFVHNNTFGSSLFLIPICIKKPPHSLTEIRHR
jgi:hypothetical protein